MEQQQKPQSEEVTQEEKKKSGRKPFHESLSDLINIHGKDNEANTPDYILAEYLGLCLANYISTVNKVDNHKNGVQTGTTNGS